MAFPTNRSLETLQAPRSVFGMYIDPVVLEDSWHDLQIPCIGELSRMAITHQLLLNGVLTRLTQSVSDGPYTSVHNLMRAPS